LSMIRKRKNSYKRLRFRISCALYVTNAWHAVKRKAPS